MTEAPQERPQPAVGIATAIGEALTRATEVSGPGRAEDAAEVR